MLLQRPHLLKQLEEDASRSLSMLGGLEGLGRSIMVGLMPLVDLVDLEVLETKQAVTNAYLGGGCLALLWLYTSVDERLLFIVAMGTALISSLL